MNNSNECNGNHAMLVILFSVACPSAPPQPPTSLQEQENKLQEQRHVSHISTVISLHYSQSKRRDIRQSGNTYRSTAALFHLSPNTPQHTHTHTSHVLNVFWPFYLARCVRTQLEVTLIGAVASLAGGIDRLRQ